MKNWKLSMLLSVIVFFCFSGSVNASIPYDNYQLSLPRLIQGNGTLTIYVLKDGSWQSQGSLALDKYYREKSLHIDLSDSPVGPVRVRLVKEGGGGAHIDSVLLGGLPAVALAPQMADGLTKLASKDFDVLHGFDDVIELSFDNPEQGDLFTITARIEAERLAEIPFQLPLVNLYKKMGPDSQFWTYSLDSNRGTVDDSRPLESTANSDLFFKELLQAGSGHPSDYVYGWVQNDDENLYVIMDLTGDNTRDGEKDYAKVYVKTPEGLKTFKVTESDSRWGESHFMYTDKVNWQHKVYSFRIPFDDIGINPAEMSNPLDLAFAAYGTLAPPALSKVFDPDTIGPGSVSTLTFTMVNVQTILYEDIAFTDNLPDGVTIADFANAFTDCGGESVTLDAPVGGTTITFSSGELGAFEACTASVDVTAEAVDNSDTTYTNTSSNYTALANGESLTGSSATDDLNVDIDLPGFSKAFSPQVIPLGGRSTLTFTVDNTANAAAATFLSFTDNLPAGLEVASPSNASHDCTSGGFTGGTLTAVSGSGIISLTPTGGIDIAAVAAGATCSVSVDVVSTGGGLLGNASGELTSIINNISYSSGKANATLEVTKTDLALVKSFTDDPIAPGGTATLDFTIYNFDRDFSASGISFTDDLAVALADLTFSSLLSNDCGGSVSGTGTTAISFSGGTVAPQTSCTIRVSLFVPGGAAPGAYINTTGAVTGTIDGSPVTGNAASDTLFVDTAPRFIKEFINDPVTGGDTVTLRFTITNTDPASSLTNIAFTDDLNAAILGLAANGLVNGDSASPQYDVCGDGSLLSVNDPPDIVIGQTTIVVPADPTMLEFAGGSLNAAGQMGDSCTFDIVLDVPAGPPSGAYLNTTSTLTATPKNGEPASDTLVVNAAPQLTKAFTDDPVAPNDTVTLEFTLSHPAEATGPATDIGFTDNLTAVLAGLTVNLPPAPDPPCGAGSSLTAPGNVLTLQNGSLIPGETCTFSIALDVPAGAAPGSYVNTTSVVGAFVESTPVTSAAATATLSVAGLSFTKEFVDDPVIAGETATLRFTIENIHPTEDTTGIEFTDDLTAVLPGTPDLSVSVLPTTPCGPSSSISGTSSLSLSNGELTTGTSCTFDVTVLVPADAADGTYINATSSLLAIQGGAAAIAPATDELIVNSTLLQLSKEFTDDPVAPGDSVTLEYALTNFNSDQAASAIAFEDVLDDALAGLTFDSVLLDTCGGTISGTGTTTIGISDVSLGAGGECAIRVSLTVPGMAAASIYTSTTGGVTGTINGLSVTGDAASDDLEVVELLEFSKSFGGPTTATGTITLTFTITNPGGSTASDISFTDDLASVIPGLTASGLPTNPCGTGSLISGTSFLTFTGGELPPMGGTCSFDVDIQVPAAAPSGTYPNATSELTKAGLKVADPAAASLVIEPPPAFLKSFNPSVIGEGQTSTLTFTIDNTASVLGASSLSFTDNLPAGLTAATPANASTDCTGGTLTAVDGTGVISYTGGTVNDGASCTVQVDVTSSTLGTFNNTTGDLTSSAGNSGTAADTLIVVPQPGFSKAFTPDTISIGGTSTLTFTINNTGSSQAISSLDFTDNLPAGLIVATPANASTDCTGGTLAAVNGTGIISYTGGTVIDRASCTVQVDVTSSTLGTYNNITGDLTSSAGNSGPASDTLMVVPLLTFSKTFNPDTIPIERSSTLIFTIDNTGSSQAISSLNFTDSLPTGVIVASPANASSNCSGGTLTAVDGTGIISYTGGTVSGFASCTVQADVTSSTVGTYNNTTGDLTSSIGNSGSASDILTVTEKFSWTFLPAIITSCPGEPAYCYIIGDQDNENSTNSSLLKYDFRTETLELVNRLGADNVEASVLSLDGKTLYATDNGVFGEIDTTQGAANSFSPVNPAGVGAGSGVFGTVAFEDIDGLAFDPQTGDLYGSVKAFPPGEGFVDLLIQIDPGTGSYVANAFGQGIDYVQISIPADNIQNIDDITIDQNGILYGISSTDNGPDQATIIDKETGTASLAFEVIDGSSQPVQDIEGWTLYKKTLYGTSGSSPGTANNLYMIDKDAGTAELIIQLDQDFNGYVPNDFEAISCYPVCK